MRSTVAVLFAVLCLFALPASASAAFGETLSVGAEGYHSCVVETTGALKCWGANSHGQLGDGTKIDSGTPAVVPGLESGVRSVSAFDSNTCALLDGGSLKCWGANASGQVGNGSTGADVMTPTQVTGLTSGVTSVAIGFGSACALLDTGVVKCWGEGSYGQLGGGDYASHPTPNPVVGIANAKAIAGGYTVSCALLTTGQIKCWGNNTDGQLGNGDITHATQTSPTFVDQITAATSITVGRSHACALIAGAAKCWGSNSTGQVGDNTVVNRDVPTDVTGLSSGVTSIDAGSAHTCAIVSDNVKCWGYNGNGELSDGTTTNRSVPTATVGVGTGNASIAAGRSHACVLRTAGTVNCWGNNLHGNLGRGFKTVEQLPTTVSGISASSVSAGSSTTCTVVAAAAKCFGYNGNSQLGDGTTTDAISPVTPTGLSSGVKDVQTNFYHSCALMLDTTVYCWGLNDHGQLGDTTVVNKTTPTLVPGLTGVTAISVGFRHTCAVVAGGAVKCWGENIWGALGDNSTTDRHVPTAVSGLTGVVSLSLSSAHSCAVTGGGVTSCWGLNSDGRLGDGTTTQRQVPTVITGAAGAIQVANFYDHTCAVITGGTIKCWGKNNWGQLGDNLSSGVSSMLPVTVSGITTATAVAVGQQHTCAILAGGAAKCWGANYRGSVGNGVFNDSDTAELVPDDVFGLGSGVLQITAGSSQSCARLTGGTLKCWGYGDYGQLGNGAHYTLAVTSPTGLSTVALPGSEYVAPAGPPAALPTPLPLQPPPLKTSASKKIKLAKNKKSAKVTYVCGATTCKITLTVRLGTKKYKLKAKSVKKSATAKGGTVTISIPSKIVKKIKAAKKSPKLSVAIR